MIECNSLNSGLLLSFPDKMAKVVRRDVGPFLAKVRDLLIGRKHMNNLRIPVRIYRVFTTVV